jgi:ubiquinone/menaquinone biosynthesis C-methylase UbiE
VSWWGNWEALDPLGTTFTGALEALQHLGPLPLPWEVRADYKPDIGYVPIPHGMVKPMLEAAAVKPGETVYDLGCGDGRIVIAAARHFGARGMGIDLNVELVQAARAAAAAAGVRHLARFERANMFEVDLTPADVVTTYLLRELNLKLVPQFKTLKPGARVVAYEFDLPGYEPTRTALAEYEPGVEGMVRVWEAPF